MFTPLIAASPLAQGIISWALPLAVYLAVLLWYFLLIRRRHPD